jgi:predicted nucleic acid-binding protein
LTEFLIDSNILVYIQDPEEKQKQALARTLVNTLVRRGAVVLSVQCLTEFYRITRWKIRPALSHKQAMHRIELLTANCRIVPLTPEAAFEGMRICDQYSLSFWDSMIWAVAKDAGLEYVLSEDFTDGQSIEGVTFRNPFLPDFEIDSLLT